MFSWKLHKAGGNFTLLSQGTLTNLTSLCWGNHRSIMLVKIIIWLKNQNVQITYIIFKINFVLKEVPGSKRIKSKTVWRNVCTCSTLLLQQNDGLHFYEKMSLNITTVTEYLIILSYYPTGCPTSNRIVISSKLRFSLLIGKFK